jgi:two-component system, cell cycle sensor histidine kinase and response regulator CckA
LAIPQQASSVTDDQIRDFPLAGAHTILVVDDVGVVRKVAFRLLSDAGYRVFEAASAAEALEVLATARQPIDLAVVDVIMPDVSGVDLVRLIHEEWPAVRILFMSAHPAEILVREGLDHPGVFFLAKPFTRTELMEKVELVLRSRKHDGQSSTSARPSD